MAKALVFGEVLWDVFGEEKTIGGAPFNFAAHFAALGGEAAFCSAVGRDALGTAARSEIRKLRVNDALTVESDLPTGACQVTLGADGMPRYQLLENVAYDAIPVPAEPVQADLLYLGTLARRSAVSARTAAQLAKSGGFREIFVDINVRRPFISREVLAESLAWATILKISREEAGCLAEFGLLPEQKDGEALMRSLAASYPQLRLILMTLDRDGACVYDARRGAFIYSAKPESTLVSAVGAGDSFAACFAWNYLNGKSIGEALDRGVLLSDYVVTQLGAVPEIPASLLERIQ